MNRSWIQTRKRKLKDGRTVKYRYLRWRQGGKMPFKGLGPVSEMTAAEAKQIKDAKDFELLNGAVSTYAGKRLRVTEVDLAKAKANRRPRAGVTIAVKHFVAGVSDLYIDQITVQHAVDFKIWLGQRKVPNGSRTITDATVIKNQKVLQTLWNWAKKLGYTTGAINPFTASEIGKAGAKDARIITVEEQDAIEDVLRCRGDEWWLTLFRLAMATGLRRNELLYLRWKDVEAGRIHVRNHTTPLKFKVKAKSSTRLVPITDDIVAMLDKWQGGTDYLFLSDDRVQRLRGSTARCPVCNLRRQLIDILREADIAEPLPGLHDMRKTCLTRWARNGVPMHNLQKYAGHSSITTTANHYLTVTPADESALRTATEESRKNG